MSCFLGCFRSKSAESSEIKKENMQISPISRVSSSVVLRVGQAGRFGLEALNTFWFVPFGAVLFMVAGRHWMPLNGMIFGGTTLASLVAFSTLPQKGASPKKRAGALLLNATMIMAATTLFGVACNLLRQVPRVLNYAAPIGVGLTGLLTGHALVRFAIQSVRKTPSRPTTVKRESLPASVSSNNTNAKHQGIPRSSASVEVQQEEYKGRNINIIGDGDPQYSSNKPVASPKPGQPHSSGDPDLENNGSSDLVIEEPVIEELD